MAVRLPSSWFASSSISFSSLLLILLYLAAWMKCRIFSSKISCWLKSSAHPLAAPTVILMRLNNFPHSLHMNSDPSVLHHIDKSLYHHGAHELLDLSRDLVWPLGALTFPAQGSSCSWGWWLRSWSFSLGTFGLLCDLRRRGGGIRAVPSGPPCWPPLGGS